MTIIDYGFSSEAWANAVPLIEQMIEQRGFRRVIEIGGGANPTLSLDFVARHGLDYALLDISQAELDKAPEGYVKILADISAAEFAAQGGYDFAFSRMLAEHVSSGARFHRNVRALLRDGGVAFHFFPTLFAPPFVANYLLPEALAERLLHFLQPGREKSGKLGKFPGRYSWCRGPLKSQIKRFEGIGFAVEKYSGFFGHEPYYRKIPLLHRLHLRLCAWLQRHPVAALTSFAQVTLVKK
ncbi:MAG: methyltransferase domain-containing protein [Rugosibacter sp.]